MTDLLILSGGVPPAPNKASAQGYTAAQFVQFEPWTQSEIEEAYHEGTPLNSIYPKTQNLYSIGGLGMFPLPPNFGRYALGENSPATQKRLIDKNVKKYIAGFTISSPYSGTGDTNFHKDIWSLQTIVFWLTDGVAFSADFPNMVGLVTKNGHNPTDLTPLKLQSDGRVIEDLKGVFPKSKLPAGETAPRGPDGIYGVQTDSILAEYARTGKAFGKKIPSNVVRLFDRVLQGVNSNEIRKARSAAASGLTTPKTTADKIPTEMKSGDAQKSAGETVTKTLRETPFIPPAADFTPPFPSEPVSALPPVPVVPPASQDTPPASQDTPPAPKKKSAPAAQAKEDDVETRSGDDDDNTFLIVGGILGAVALAGAVYLWSDSSKKKKNKDKKLTPKLL